MKATTLLVEHHKRVAEVLSRLDHDVPERIALLLELVDELMAHLALEDQFFFSEEEVRAACAGEGLEPFLRTQPITKNALVRTLLAEPDDESFALRLSELRALFQAHVDREERALLPAVDARVEQHHLERIGDRMQRFYSATTARPREEEPAHAMRRRPLSCTG